LSQSSRATYDVDLPSGTCGVTVKILILFILCFVFQNSYAKCPEGFWFESQKNECVIQLCPAQSLAGAPAWQKIGNGKTNFFTDDAGGVRMSVKLNASNVMSSVLKTNAAVLKVIKSKTGKSMSQEWWHENSNGKSYCVKQVCESGSLPGISKWSNIANSNYFTDDNGGIRIRSDDTSLCMKNLCPKGFWYENNQKKCVMQVCPANSVSGVQAWTKIGNTSYFIDDQGGVRFSKDVIADKKLVIRNVDNRSVNGEWWRETNNGHDRCVRQVCGQGAMPGVPSWTKIANSNYYTDDKGGLRVFSDDKSNCQPKFSGKELVRKKSLGSINSRNAKGSVYVLSSTGKCIKISSKQPWHESAHYNNINECKKAIFNNRKNLR